jgi:hypothetical protein
MAFYHRAQSDKCFFQLLVAGLTPVSLLESKSGFEVVTQLASTGTAIFTSIVYVYFIFFSAVLNTRRALKTRLIEHFVPASCWYRSL